MEIPSKSCLISKMLEMLTNVKLAKKEKAIFRKVYTLYIYEYKISRDTLNKHCGTQNKRTRVWLTDTTKAV